VAPTVAPIIITIAYTLITALCVGMSGWTTYHGYETEMGSLALPVAIAVTIGLFASDMILLERRSRGHSIIGAVLVLTIFTIASLAANFHFFYGKFVGSSIAQGRYEQALVTYTNNLSTAEVVINTSNGLPALSRQISQELKSLQDEVNDPVKPCFGPKAKDHFTSLKTLVSDKLKVKMAWPDLPECGGKKSDTVATLDAIVQRVRDAQKQADDANVWSSAYTALKKAQGETSRLAASEVGDLGPDQYLSRVKSLADETRRLALAISRASEQSGTKSSVVLTPTSPEGAQLDRITDSWRHGVIERPNIAYTVGAAVFAILIDFMPLIFALLMVRPPTSEVARAESEARSVTGGRPNKRPKVLNPPSRTPGAGKAETG